MKYRKLILITILACILVPVSFFVANVVLNYLTAGGINISSKMQGVVVLVAIMAPAVLMLPRIRSEAEALNKKDSFENENLDKGTAQKKKGPL